MQPTEFREATKRLTKPEGWTDEQCGTLPVFCDGNQCVSRWSPSWRERLAILFGAPVWLRIWSGQTQHPVRVDARRWIFRDAQGRMIKHSRTGRAARAVSEWWQRFAVLLD